MLLTYFVSVIIDYFVPVMAHNHDDLADFVAVNGNGFGGSHSSSASNGPSPVPSMPRIEAENIRKWREQQAARLEKKGKEVLSN